MFQAQQRSVASSEEPGAVADCLPLSAFATRLGQTASQLPQLSSAWDSGNFTLDTGHGRAYQFNDEAIKSMPSDKMVYLWEVGFRGGQALGLTARTGHQPCVNTAVQGTFIQAVHGYSCCMSSGHAA